MLLGRAATGRAWIAGVGEQGGCLEIRAEREGTMDVPSCKYCTPRREGRRASVERFYAEP